MIHLIMIHYYQNIISGHKRSRDSSTFENENRSKKFQMPLGTYSFHFILFLLYVKVSRSLFEHQYKFI